MVLNDWPLSKFYSLPQNALCICCDFKCTLRTWPGASRTLYALANSDVGSNVELEVKKNKDQWCSPPHPTKFHSTYTSFGFGSQRRGRKDLWGTEKGRRMDLQSILNLRGGVKRNASHKRMTARSSQSPNQPNLSIALMETSWEKTPSLLIQTQSRTSQDLWPSSLPPCKKSAEGPPSAGMQQKMQNQEAWEWLTRISKISQRLSYWFTLWFTLFHSPRHFSFQSWLFC